jgi:NDP-4-keto-2,6-dideoxyhexose 3-C-methyltransferase
VMSQSFVMTTYRLHETCRICGNSNLETVVDLGLQPISSVFPSEEESDPSTTPLHLVRCSDSAVVAGCGLLQLLHTASLDEMYGSTYGYHSSLSNSMVVHLEKKAADLSRQLIGDEHLNILDIGCNDGTLLNAFNRINPSRSLGLYGVDPSSEKFRDNFSDGIKVDYKFFSDEFAQKFEAGSFALITSIAMFYDIDDPISFVTSIKRLLAPNGVWAFELSYLPLFLQQLSYDQICHEHVTYYSLRDLNNLLQKHDLSIYEVSLNDMNGGSIYLKVCHSSAHHHYRDGLNDAYIERLISQEDALDKTETYENFRWRLKNHIDELSQFFDMAKLTAKSVYGYGASTKGNILAHFCGIGRAQIPAIGDLNIEKHGRFTPGTRIPIMSHEAIKNYNPDYLFVFIWHFRSEVIRLNLDYIRSGGSLVFPLPRLHIVNSTNLNLYMDKPLSLNSFSL